MEKNKTQALNLRLDKPNSKTNSILTSIYSWHTTQPLTSFSRTHYEQLGREWHGSSSFTLAVTQARQSNNIMSLCECPSLATLQTAFLHDPKLPTDETRHFMARGGGGRFQVILIGDIGGPGTHLSGLGVPTDSPK